MVTVLTSTLCIQPRVLQYQVTPVARVRGVRLHPLPGGYLVVTFGYQGYQVLHDSMMCTWSMVTSVTWWLPVVTMCYQRYQVLHDSAVYVVYCYLSYFVGTSGYLWLRALPGIAVP